MLLSKYKEQYGDPAENGHVTQMMQIQGALKEVVLIRKTPVDEWDVELNTSVETRMTEVIDDGEQTCRSGQQRMKHKAIGDAVTAMFKRRDGKEIADESKLIMPVQSMAPLMDGQPEDSQLSDESASEADIVGQSSLLDDLLPGLVTAKPKSQVTVGAKRGAPSTSATSAGARKIQKSTPTTSPAQVSMPLPKESSTLQVPQMTETPLRRSACLCNCHFRCGQLPPGIPCMRRLPFTRPLFGIVFRSYQSQRSDSFQT